MAASEHLIPDVWAWRLKEAEQDIAKKADKDYVDSIAEEVRGLRKAVIALMTAIVSSAVLVSLTMFATLGSKLIGG
jgi:hypothetical protein